MAEEQNPLQLDADSFLREAAALDAGQADQAEPGAAGAPGAAPEQPKATTADMLRPMLAGAVRLAAARFPSVPTVWTDAVVGEVAGVLAPVLDKYELDIFAWLEKWRPEIMALITCVPLAFTTARAISEDLEREKASKAKPVTPGAETGEGAPGVSS